MTAYFPLRSRLAIDKRRVSAAGILLMLATYLAFPSSPARAQPPSTAERVSVVEVEPVQRDAVSSYARFVATVVPTRRSVVGTAVDGRVEEFLFDPNDETRKVTQVRRGQALAQLKTDTISREVGIAQAELRLRQAELEELRNGARPEELAAAKAQLEAAAARRDYAASRYMRLQKLFDSNTAVSLDQLEEAKSLVDQAEQSYQATKADHELLVAGPRSEEIQQAEARVAGQQETVARLEEIRNKYTVKAPFDGVVVSEFTEVGAWVSQGDSVAEVIQIHPVEVEAFLPEKLIPELTIGDHVLVELDARPSRPYSGVIHRIIPQADVRSRTFPIRIRLDEAVNATDEGIMAGMLGRVTPDLPTATNVLLVHKDALVLEPERKSVIVVDPVKAESHNGVTRVIPVVVGIARGSHIQIQGEIQPGELVVIRGNERLRPGQKVKFHPAQ
jgi:RND family efflux transporter MFP subunit